MKVLALNGSPRMKASSTYHIMNPFLEGSGTRRRHLKIFQKEDIENKKAEYYIRQSFTL